MAGGPVSKQRLFVVVHKGVTEDALARLFRWAGSWLVVGGGWLMSTWCPEPSILRTERARAHVALPAAVIRRLADRILCSAVFLMCSYPDLVHVFRRFHGMEYCDLKKDRTTGKSKVSALQPEGQQAEAFVAEKHTLQLRELVCQWQYDGWSW
jgi:hypothetical protein